MKKQPPQTKQPKKSSNSTKIAIIAVSFLPIVVILLIVMLALKSKNTVAPNTSVNTNSEIIQPTEVRKSAEITTDPAITITKENQVTEFSVILDTDNQKVNAVEILLSYPTDSFEFIKIDDSDSAFAIKAEASNKDGKITISRGSVEPVTGKQLIAKLVLKAKTATGEGEIKILDESKVLAVAENQSSAPVNILKSSAGAKLTIEQ